MRMRCRTWLLLGVVVSVGCEAPLARLSESDPLASTSSGDDISGSDAPTHDTFGSTSAAGSSSGGATRADASTEAGSSSGGVDGSTTAPDVASSSGGDPPAALGCTGREDLLLCEDFESGSIDPSRWTIMTQNGGQVAVVEELAVAGTHALRVDIPLENGARGALVTVDGTVFPLQPNHFFGRAFVHVTPDAPPSHSLLFFAEGDLGGKPVRYRLDSNNRRLNSRYVNPSLDVHGGLKKMSDYFLPADQWICIEWEYDGELDEMRYWVDDELLDEAEVTQNEDPPWIAPVFDRFEIGFRTYQPADVPAVVYWDEIALATFRIGCG